MTPLFTMETTTVNIYGDRPVTRTHNRVRNPLYVGSIRGFGAGGISEFDTPLKKFFVEKFSISDVERIIDAGNSITIVSTTACIYPNCFTCAKDISVEITNEVVDHISDDELVDYWKNVKSRFLERFSDGDFIVGVERYCIGGCKTR